MFREGASQQHGMIYLAGNPAILLSLLLSTSTSILRSGISAGACTRAITACAILHRVCTTH